MNKPPYRSVKHALSASYAMCASNGCKTQEYEIKILPRNPERLTYWEKIAGGAMIISFVRSKLSPFDKAVIEAYYCPIILRTYKERNCRQVAEALAGDDYPLEYVARCVEWATGAIRSIDNKRWAKSLGVSRRTLQRWRTGHGDKAGFLMELKHSRTQAMSRLENEMIKAGLI